MRFASKETIAKIRNALAEREAKILNAKTSLDNARQIAADALEVKIGQQLIEYIDQGMSIEEFILKTLKFCESDRSDVKAIPFRASYTIALIEEWEESLPPEETQNA
jgi:hypothetical protein